MPEPILGPVPDHSHPLAFELDGLPVEIADPEGRSLLDVIREDLGATVAKDGCSPQGQCGCCTVLVDGAPRVSCVTPARRVAGRSVTTMDGLDPAIRDAWAGALCATGGSQCGFCTPGIVVRLEGLRAKTGDLDRATAASALGAHLCRCTGWQTVLEAAALATAALAGGEPVPSWPGTRDVEAAAARAEIEGGAPQRVSPDVARGAGGFADDTSPAGALVAVPDGAGGWAVGETLAEARSAAGTVQGRRTTVPLRHPLEVPDGEWVATLRTTWVEPAYLEVDASWCEPGGEPASPLANGGAFGGKHATVVAAAARELADRHGRAVRVVLPREAVVRTGPKRPPVAAGMRPDGTGVIRVVATRSIAERILAAAPGLEVVEVDVAGPPTSAAIRAAGWAEAEVLRAGVRGAAAPVRAPGGGVAEATVEADGTIRVAVRCGRPLDDVVLRSYCIGAAHMALGWVVNEGIAVDAEGVPLDLTMRSFGVLRAADTPPVVVTIEPDDADPVRGSDAVFAAVASAVWLHRGCPQDWPCDRPSADSPPPRPGARP